MESNSDIDFDLFLKKLSTGNPTVLLEFNVGPVDCF